MSRRSRARRKLARRNFRSCREAPRVACASDAAPGQAYPRLHDLLASGPGWRELLETTLRAVLRPAAIVSAVGLAGCGAQSHASVTGDTTTVESSSQSTGTGAVLVAMPPVGPEGRVVVGKLPPPPAHVAPAVVQTTPVPALHRPPPGVLHGSPNVVPVPHPFAVRGEMAAVDPEPCPLPQPDPNANDAHAQPTPEPIPAPGGASVVQPSS